MKLLRAIFAVFLFCSLLSAQHPKPPRPTTMKIDKVLWKVEWYREGQLKYFNLATGKRVAIAGYTNCDDHVFRLEYSDDLADTILHEIQHAYAGCEYSHYIETHEYIYRHSAALARWIQDNPRWVRYVQSLPHPDNYFDE